MCEEQTNSCGGRSRGSEPRLAGTLTALVAIAAAAGLAYSNSFQGPFVLDDHTSILANPYIRSLWPLWRTFRAPWGTQAAGRPVVCFTYALNYAVSGYEVWSYHAANLLIHLAAALTLFGVVRRALGFGELGRRYGRVATGIALASTLVWVVHPLQTESVTYVVQRTESLMGLFFLLTLYCALRGWGSAARTRWHVAAAVACLIGVGCKEVTVAAPFVVLLFDWMFVHRGVREALGRSRVLYVGLAVCLVVLGVLVAVGGTVASGTWGGQFTPVEYGWTQAQVILHYVRLAVWPSGLCLDMGWPIVPLGRALPSVVVVVTLVAGTVAAVWRRHRVGFVGGWFFLVLAPTSSINPVVDVAFEHRMYLPLAALVVLAVTASYEVGARLVRRRELGQRLAAGGVALLVIVLGRATYTRNQDYRTAVQIWSDTVAKRPEHARPRKNLGFALINAGRPNDAARHLRVALRLEPDDPEAHNYLGLAHYRLGRTAEAIVEFEAALRHRRDFVEAHNNLGLALTQAERYDEAIGHLREAIRLAPPQAATHNNLGMALALAGRGEEAVPHLRRAIALKPDFARAHANLARALAELGRRAEAIRHYEEALRLRPDLDGARKALERLRKAASAPGQAGRP